MELRQLKYFIKSAESENFSVAAQECFVVQSTLSHQIKQLETDLGVTLFDRVGKRVALTEAGRVFLPLARATVAAAEEGRQQLKDMEQLKSGRLRVGVTYGLSVLLTRALQLFCPRYPGVQFDIRFERTNDILPLLRSGDLDLALAYCHGPFGDDVQATPLFSSCLCALVDPQHPLALRGDVSLPELAPWQVAIPARGMSSRYLLDELLRQTGLALQPLMELNEIYTMIHMVHSCQIVALHTRSSVFDEDDIRTLPIRESTRPMQASLLTIVGKYSRRAVDEFSSCVLAASREAHMAD